MKPSSRQEVQKTPSSADKSLLHVSQTQIHSGPLPHPEILKGYDQLLPGAAERVLSNWEKESESRRQNERRLIECEEHVVQEGMSAQKRGQWMAEGVLSFV